VLYYAIIVKVVSDLEVGTDRTLVGAISWGDSVDIDFRLDDHVTRPEVLTALDYIRYTGGLTNTAAALNLLRTQMFWASSRPGAILPGSSSTGYMTFNNVNFSPQSDRILSDHAVVSKHCWPISPAK